MRIDRFRIDLAKTVVIPEHEQRIRQQNIEFRLHSCAVTAAPQPLDFAQMILIRIEPRSRRIANRDNHVVSIAGVTPGRTITAACVKRTYHRSRD